MRALRRNPQCHVMQTYKRTFVFTNIMRKNRGIGNGLASGSREWRHADGELFIKKNN